MRAWVPSVVLPELICVGEATRPELPGFSDQGQPQETVVPSTPQEESPHYKQVTSGHSGQATHVHQM